MQTHHVKSLTDAIRAANCRRVVWNGGGTEESEAASLDSKTPSEQEKEMRPERVGPSAELLTV